VAAHQPFFDGGAEKVRGVQRRVSAVGADATSVKALNAVKTPADSFHVRGRELYWLSTIRQGESKISNAVFEKKLGQRSTVRGSYIRKMAEKFGA